MEFIMHDIPFILQKIQSDFLAKNEMLSLMHSIHFWRCYDLQKIINSITPEDRVKADLENITVEQYVFNKWMIELEKSGDGFKTGFRTTALPSKPVKLSWWKCWFWWIIPGFFLGVDDRMKFCGWKIGHCLNCDADPYDGSVECWDYDAGWFRGALIRCNKCGQLRWQVGESGRDY